MRALSRLSLLLPCLATLRLLLLSSLFLPLWSGVGKGLRLYLDGAASPLGGQSQPFIQDGGGSGISPAGIRPRRQGSLVGGQRSPRPAGSCLSRIQLRSPSVGPVLSQFLPPLEAPERRQVAMAFVTVLPARPGVPTGQSPRWPEAAAWNGGWKANPEP